MKAHISLIKKDLFLMGNYLCFIPVFTLVLPFFYYWRLPDFSLQKGTGLLILIVASVYSEFLAYEQIFLKDAEYPKALFCAPHPTAGGILYCAGIFCSAWFSLQPRLFTPYPPCCCPPPSSPQCRNMASLFS